MQKTFVTPLVESALVSALAMALSYIPDFVAWFSPSFGAIPLIIFSLRRGTKYGILSGLIWGLLHFLLGKTWYLSLTQVTLEYIVAFLAMGLAGLVSNRFQTALQKESKKLAILWAFLGAVIGVVTRYFCHFVAGFIFWGSYAPKGVSAVWYSFTVNGTAGALTLIFVLLAIFFILSGQKKIFLP